MKGEAAASRDPIGPPAPLPPPPGPENPPRILAVIVLYRRRPSQAPAVRTLARALAAASQAVDCRVRVYDNSPGEDNSPRQGHRPGEDTSAADGVSGSAASDSVPGSPVPDEPPLPLPPGFTYIPMPVNRGLSAPYEGARRAAHDPRDPREWLLTLDQDTALPEDFFSALAPGLAAAAADPRIAALVPRLAERGRPLSPSAVGRFGTRPLPPSSNGVPRGEIRAFNSAALLRVAALDDVGGFSPCFRLDYLDCWLHHALFLGGWRVYVLGSLQLEHELSLLNYRERISPERFRGFLAAEAAYTDLYGGWPARVAYTARLAVRLFNQRRRGEAAEIRRETRRMLAQRLTRPRSRRLARWRTAQGCGPEAAAASTPDAGPATTSATASVTRSGAAGATAEPPQSVEPDRTKSAAQNGRPDEIAGRAAERGRKRSRKRGRKPGQERGQ